jgi:hypothetical protein
MVRMVQRFYILKPLEEVTNGQVFKEIWILMLLRKFGTS